MTPNGFWYSNKNCNEINVLIGQKSDDVKVYTS